MSGHIYIYIYIYIYTHIYKFIPYPTLKTGSMPLAHINNNHIYNSALNTITPWQLFKTRTYIIRPYMLVTQRVDSRTSITLTAF